MEVMAENGAEIVHGRPFVKGFDPRRDISGGKKGIRNFSTDFDEAVEFIAKRDNITKSEARMKLLIVAYDQANKGIFPFWQEIAQREYGKPDDNLNLKGGVTINIKTFGDNDSISMGAGEASSPDNAGQEKIQGDSDAPQGA